MTFDLLALRRVIGWISVVFFLSNHLLHGFATVSYFNEHNQQATAIQEARAQKPKDLGAAITLGIVSLAAGISGNDETWDPDYAKIFLNPFDSLDDMDTWGAFNHLFFWGSIAAALAWVILRGSVRSETSAGRASLRLFGPKSISLRNPKTEETRVVKLGKGPLEIFLSIRYWFARRIALKDYVWGAIGILSIISVIYCASDMEDDAMIAVGWASFYIVAGVYFSITESRDIVNSFLNDGWSVVDE